MKATNKEIYIRKVYDIGDSQLRIKDTTLSLILLEIIAKRNNTTLAEIYSKKIFPVGEPVLDLHDENNKLTIVEHIFKKLNALISWKDPTNKLFMIGKLKKRMWLLKEKKKLVIEYDARGLDDSYFI